MIDRYAIIPTHSRPDDLERCLDSIQDEVDRIFVIDNASSPPVPPFRPLYHLIQVPDQPPNLSRLWNLGLEAVRTFHQELLKSEPAESWNVAILNDDAIVPPGWFQAMSEAMRTRGCAAACQTPFGGTKVVHHGPEGAPGVHNRLTGWAFMLRGEQGLRFDERLRWWASDDLMSLECRRNGGIVHVPGFPVVNSHANESTVGELAEQAAKDMAMFVEITGTRPW